MVTSCLGLLEVFKLIPELRWSPSDEPASTVLPAIFELDEDVLYFDLLVVAIFVYSRIGATLFAKLMLCGLQGLEESCYHDIWEHIEHDHIDVVWKVLEVVIEIERSILLYHRLVVEGMDNGREEIFVLPINVSIDAHIATG